MINKEIRFNVRDYFDEKLRTSAKAKGFVNALMGVKETEEEFKKTVYDKCVEELEAKIDRIARNIDEIRADKNMISEINTMLGDLGSNLRLKHYIYTTKDIELRSDIYLVGNGYFRQIYQITDIQIPAKDHYGWEMDDDYKTELKDDYLYITEDDTIQEVDLSENKDDGIDYEGSFLDVLCQVLLTNKIKSRHDWVGYLDVASDDGKIEAGIETDDICDLFLIAHGQERTDRHDSRYEITYKELDRIFEQVKDIRIKQNEPYEDKVNELFF